MAATVHRSRESRRARIGRFARGDVDDDPSTVLNAIANRFERRRAGPVLQ
jgi:hypothetical protein